MQSFSAKEGSEETARIGGGGGVLHVVQYECEYEIKKNTGTVIDTDAGNAPF